MNVFGVCWFVICGLGGPGTLGLLLLICFLVLKFFNVGGWLTHCDFALGAAVDFLAVVEHRLIPGRVRNECNRLRRKGLASVWAPACQDSSHVGHAGVGVVSLREAPVALPSFATSQFKVFFDLGSAVRCLLPLVLVVSCICLFFMVIRVLILMLSSLLSLISYLMLL